MGRLTEKGGGNMAVQEGALYRAVVEGYASDGSGVARVEGLAVFVRGAVRGETVDLRIEHIGHSAAWGHIEGVAAPSPARREPDCPYYGRCGGCQDGLCRSVPPAL